MLPNRTLMRPYDANSRNNFPFSMEGCVLYLPLWQEDMQGSPIISYDQYRHSCTVTGALWTPQGRTFGPTLDDYINCGSATSLRITGSLTLVAWVYPANINANKDIISNYDYGTSTGGYRLTLGGGGKIEFRVKGAAEASMTTTASYTANVWQHIVAVYLAATPEVIQYKQGALDAGTQAGTMPSPLNSVANDVLIGATRNGGAGTEFLWMNGTIGEVHIYNRALTPAEIQNIYNATKWRYQ